MATVQESTNGLNARVTILENKGVNRMGENGLIVASYQMTQADKTNLANSASVAYGTAYIGTSLYVLGDYSHLHVQAVKGIYIEGFSGHALTNLSTGVTTNQLLNPIAVPGSLIKQGEGVDTGGLIVNVSTLASDVNSFYIGFTIGAPMSIMNGQVVDFTNMFGQPMRSQGWFNAANITFVFETAVTPTLRNLA